MSIKLVIQPWLESLIDVLWKNKSQIIKILNDRTRHRIDIDSCSTELLGIPEEILEEFPHSDFIQMLNEIVPDILDESRTKKAFARKLAESITDGVVTVR
ncbi:MAG TPA: hypothetical protein VM577_18645 [Anaerovoracaceae bacterium]|nr:hypothetical protein [Anaerovoracaceae bacterium]